MDLLMVQIINAIIQVSLFSFIPLVWWFFRGRKQSGVILWIGLKSIPKNNIKKVISLSSVTLLGYVGLGFYLVFFLLKDVELATSVFEGLGITGLPAGMVYAFIITGLSEEIIFRGFIWKKLSSKISFKLANIIQATLFGLLHGVMFFALVNPVITMIIIILTGIIAGLMGYINEIEANGSIVPSWIIHGLCNLFTLILALFSII